MVCKGGGRAMKNPKVGERVRYYDSVGIRDGKISELHRGESLVGVVLDNKNNLVVHRTHLIRLKPKRKLNKFAFHGYKFKEWNDRIIFTATYVQLKMFLDKKVVVRVEVLSD